MGMTASTVPAERVRSGRWLVVAAMAVPLLMLTIDAFGLTVALPAIGHALDTTTTTLAWVFNAFLFTFAAPQIAAGRLADTFGRRRVVLLGLITFIAGSIAAGTAQSIGWLIAARALQGLGTALSFVASLAIVSNAFPPADRGQAIGIWAAAGTPHRQAAAQPAGADRVEGSAGAGRGVVSQLLHEVPRPRDGGRWRRDRSAVLGDARLPRGLPGGRARRRPHAQRYDLVLRFLEAGRRGGDSRLRDRAGAPRAEAVESVNPQVLVELGDAEADLGRRALEDDAPAVEDDDVVGDVEDQLGVLLHEDDGEPLGLEATDRRHHLGHDLRRQSFRGLVHQQHPGVRHQRAGDREHLLLAARERNGDLVPALAQAWEERRHGVERPQHRQVTARPASGHREILAHGEALEDPAALGHERDAVGGDRLRGAPGDGPAVDRHHAVSRRQQAHDDVQRRRLARAVAAEQAEQAALGEPQRHAVEHVAVAVERVDLAQHERVTRQDRSPACAGGRRPHPAGPRRPPGRSAAR